MPHKVGTEALSGSAGEPISTLLQHHAQSDPDRPSLTIGSQTLSRRALDLSSNRLARAFAALGVKPGDYVTIGLPNGIEFVQACFAAWKCGAIPNPISWRLPLVEAQAIVDLVKPSLVVGGPLKLRAKRRIDGGFAPDPALSDGPTEPLVAPYWKAMSSGGSTGRPKVIVSHKDATFDPNASFQGQKAGGTVVIPGPLYNNGPFLFAMAGLFTGNHVILMPRFDELATLELLDRHQADFAFLVPTMMNRIWRLGPEVRARFDLSRLTILHSASICPVWLKQAWIDWLGPDHVIEAYGGTEGQGFAQINGREWLEHQGSVGRAVPGSQILILDPRGKELAPGEIGEIFFLPDRAGEKTYHYIGADRREVGDAGSVGDMGFLDKDGWLFIADRRTDMIVTGGANVYPAEVEAALDQHVAVRSSIVIGLPDEDLIARVHAIVQIEPNSSSPDHGELVAFLKERIATFKIPRSFEFVTADLRDDAGKARRTQLREERVMPASTGVV